MVVRRAAAAAEFIICNLCDDLMMQILSRLPPKPLAICKCVCKSWRHLVSTLTHSPTRPRQMTGLFIRPECLLKGHKSIHYCHRGDGEINVDESLSFLPSHPDTIIVDSRDGFLLCSSPNLRYGYEYCVCNPLTRQWVPLPLPPQRSCSFPVNAALALDESSDFGCLRYRVILFQIVCSENPRMRVDVFDFSSQVYIDLYSSHTGKWAESWAFFKGNMFNVPRKPPVLLDGDVLWWAIPSPYVVVMYNVKEACYKQFDFGIPMCCHSQCFGESEGCPNYAYHDGSRMEVWMWKGNTSGWVLKHNMNLTDIGFPDLSPGSGPVRNGSLELLAFHPNLHAIFIRKKGGFFCYNFDTKALETITSLHPSATAMDDKVFRVFPFSESICPLPDAQYK